MVRTTDELFGLEVQAQREDKGWSMTEFATRLSNAGLTNFHPTTIGRMERGERPVRLSEAVVIGQVLGSRLDDLIVEPLIGDESLTAACDALDEARRVARTVEASIDFWTREVAASLDELAERVAGGRVLEENLTRLSVSVERASELLADRSHASPLQIVTPADVREFQRLQRDFLRTAAEIQSAEPKRG